MPIAIGTLRTELRDHTGDDATTLDDQAADLLLNRSYWEITDKFPLREKETAATFSFEAGIRLYNVPTLFEAVRHIIISDTSDNKHVTLRQMDLEVYHSKYDSDVDARGKPTHYIRSGSQFYVFPTPDKTYNGVIEYWKGLSDLSDFNTVPDMPRVWHEIILYGAVWRRLLELRELVAAREFKNHQIALVNSTSPVQAKEEADTSRAHIEIPEEITQYP